MHENISFPKEAEHWANILFTDNINYSDEHKEVLLETGKEFFVAASQYLSDIIDNNSELNIKELANYLKEKFNVKGKKLFMPLRVSLTMMDHGPELANLVNLMGAKKVKSRFEQVVVLF